MKLSKGFTLLEMLIVLMIIGTILAIASLSYTHTKISARNTERKEELANIQIALEAYRSNDTYGSYPTSLLVGCSDNGGLSAGGITYLPSIPKDPYCPRRTYYFSTTPVSCDGTTTPCSDYTLAGALENITGSCVAEGGCGAGIACNYCLDSYGQTSQ